MRLYPGQKLGRLRVERHLSTGALTERYKAVEPGARRDWALLVFSRQAYVDPADLALDVEHPNLVSVIQVLTIDGQLALLLEHVVGPPLASLLAEGALRPDQVDVLADALCDGLMCLHRSGRCHGDLSPSAILLDLAGDAPVPRIAEPAGPTPRASTLEPELVRYRPPEALGGERLDARSDVWALAAVLYELLAGRPAFAAEDPAGLRRAIQRATPPPLGEAVPLRMRTALHAALQADPADRPADAEAFHTLWRAHEAPADPRMVSWADRRLELDDEALSLSAPVPLERPQAQATIEVVWSRQDAPDMARAPTPRPVHRTPPPTPRPAPDAPPPDPTVTLVDDDVDDDGSPASDEPDLPEEFVAAPPARRPARSPMATALIAGSIGIGTASLIATALVCAFGGWSWVSGPDAPRRTVESELGPGEVHWPDPPTLDQSDVPASHVRLQLVSHSDSALISWRSPASGETSGEPVRSGAISVVPKGDVAIAWASATRRATCVITITEDTRQLRLDGTQARCQALPSLSVTR